MAVTTTQYVKSLTCLFTKEANFVATDVLKMSLASAYTYAITHKYQDATPFTSAVTEVTNANGYTTGGVAVASQAVVDTANPWTYSTADAVWTASASGITALYSFLYDSSPGAGVKPLLLFVSFGGNVTAAAGATLTVHPNTTWLSITCTGA